MVVLKAVLRSNEYTLVEASSGEEALRQLMEKDFALILLDVQMPGLGGFETAMLIKKREKSQFVPIIFITACYGDEQSALEGYRVGAVDYIIKPFNPESLKAKVAYFAEYYKKNRKSQQQYELELETQKVIEVVSHDLKNPLAAIQLNLQSIRRSSPNPDAQSFEVPLRKVDAIERSTKQMQRLIEDLLDLAKIEGSEVHLDKELLKIKDLISDVILGMEPHAEQKKIRLIDAISEDCCMVECDPERIRQVITNLISNAIKFSNNNGDIIISASLDKTFIRLKIQDQGVGIDSDNLLHVFDRFWQAKDQAKQGTGLGLSISKWIIEAHHGKIWVESKIGAGSTFIIELPRHQ